MLKKTLTGVMFVFLIAVPVQASENRISMPSQANRGERVDISVHCDEGKYMNISFGDGSNTVARCEKNDTAKTWHQYGCKKSNQTEYEIEARENDHKTSKKITVQCQNNDSRDEKNHDDSNSCNATDAKISTRNNNVKGGERVEFAFTHYTPNQWVHVDFADGSKVDVKTNNGGNVTTWHVYPCTTSSKSYEVRAQSLNCSSVKDSVTIHVQSCGVNSPTSTPVRDTSSGSIPSCPAGTQPLFDANSATLTKGSHTGYNGTVTEASKPWVLQKINSNYMMKMDDQNKSNIDLAIQFPSAVYLDSVLVFDNDPKAGESYWSLNGTSLNHLSSGSQNNKWVPLQHFGTQTSSLVLNTGGDSAHINFCIGRQNATPIPTKVPTATPTRVPTNRPSPTPTITQNNPHIEVTPNPSVCTQSGSQKTIVKLMDFIPSQMVHVEFGDGSYVDMYMDANGNGTTDHVYASLTYDKTYTVRVVQMSNGHVEVANATVKTCPHATPTPTQPPVEACKDMNVTVKVTLEGQTIQKTFATGSGPYFPVHDAGTASVDQLFEFTANFNPTLTRYWQGQYMDLKSNYWDLKNGAQWWTHFFLKGYHNVDENQMRAVASNPVNGNMVTQIAYIPGQETFTGRDSAGNLCGVVFEQDLDPPVVQTFTQSRTAATVKPALKMYK